MDGAAQLLSPQAPKTYEEGVFEVGSRWARPDRGAGERDGARGHGDMSCGRSVILAEDFLFAGTSALLLLVAGYCSDLWYFAFVALVPFLYRVDRVDPRRGFRLGTLVGIAYLAVGHPGTVMPWSAIALVRVALGVLLFGGFGWGIGRLRGHRIAQIIYIGSLWVMVEYLLTVTAVLPAVFGMALTRSSALWHVGVLGGCLAVSFIIVVLNSLLLLGLDALSGLEHRGNATVVRPAPRWRVHRSKRPKCRIITAAMSERGPPRAATCCEY